MDESSVLQQTEENSPLRCLETPLRLGNSLSILSQHCTLYLPAAVMRLGLTEARRGVQRELAVQPKHPPMTNRLLQQTLRERESASM